RAAIGTELAAEQDGQKRADAAYRERTAALKQRRAEIDQAAQRARADLERRQQRLEQERRAATAVVADEVRVAAAMAEQPALDDAVRRAGEALLVHEGRARQCAALRGEAAVARERIRGVEQQAGAAVLRTRELRQRHQLTEEVPCHGTDLQGACKLLADACAARPLIPSAEADVTRLGEERTALQGQIRALETQLAALGDADAELRKAQTALQTALQRQAAALQLVAKAAGIDSAKQRLVAIGSDAASIGVAAQQIEDDLRVAQQRLDEEAAAAEQAFEETGAQRSARIERLQTELAALPAPDVEAQKRAAKALEEAQRRLAAAETLQRQAAAKQAAGRTQIAVLTAASAEAQRLADEVAVLEGEIGWWALLVKALGNDGVIALCIDDAGPALAQLTNELLQSCYGPRFTVSIRTQLEIAKGGQREGFDVMVFDALTGTAKSVTLMSGGERVWINECLTRAVALYLSRTAARHYETLFCDETDGALDPERKRMFMQMKREVLRIGCYRREYFISQTAELAEMADAVIDLGALPTTAAVDPVGR
ncbi:MAG TPA: DNA repair protein, partial [Burkholderiaceae bacterium]|nr:DNA repair protein [Burkholderiaceae bacterium]